MMKYNIVVIDSAINHSYTDFLTCIDLRKESHELSNDYCHSYDIVEIIHNESPNSTILLLEICNSLVDFTCSDIFRAFDFLIDNHVNFDVLNMSLGVQFADHNMFKSYMDIFVRQNNTVVIAANHPQSLSYPAILDNVIGVDVSNALNTDKRFVYSRYSDINIVGTSKLFRIKTDERYIVGKGSSYVAAQISGMISSYLLSNDFESKSKFELAHVFLSEKAMLCDNTPSKPKYSGKDFIRSIKKAIVFPFNKETRAILRNEDLVPFEICGYYDFSLGLYKGQWSDLYEPQSRHIRIQSYDEIAWNSDFDTFICGHCCEYERLVQKDIIKNIIDKCRQFEKRLYCFDYLGKEVVPDEKLFFPTIDNHNIVESRFNNSKLNNINKPIVAIMGTSSVQGKFNLQLTIRRLLLEKGYHVSNIGSEPSGYVFGFDDIIPFGYNSQLSLSSVEFVKYVNQAIKKAEISGAEIIIIGSQSGTTPIIHNNIDYLYIRQHEFLLASNPDCVILCANYYDSTSYITRTIKYIEGTTSGKVLGIFLSALEEPKQGIAIRKDRKLMPQEVMMQYCESLSNEIHIPVYSMFEALDPLIDKIISYFTPPKSD